VLMVPRRLQQHLARPLGRAVPSASSGKVSSMVPRLSDAHASLHLTDKYTLLELKPLSTPNQCSHIILYARTRAIFTYRWGVQNAVKSAAEQLFRAFPSSILLDKNRGDRGKSQSKCTAATKDHLARRSRCCWWPQHVKHAPPAPEVEPHTARSSLAHALPPPSGGGTTFCPSTVICATLAHVTLNAGSPVLSSVPTSTPPIVQFSKAREVTLLARLSGPPRIRLGRPRGMGPLAHLGTQLFCTRRRHAQSAST
jgi:hypothetical protein